jgi:hypothetical protein
MTPFHKNQFELKPPFFHPDLWARKTSLLARWRPNGLHLLNKTLQGDFNRDSNPLDCFTSTFPQPFNYHPIRSIWRWKAMHPPLPLAAQPLPVFAFFLDAFERLLMGYFDKKGSTVSTSHSASPQLIFEWSIQRIFYLAPGSNYHHCSQKS